MSCICQNYQKKLIESYSPNILLLKTYNTESDAAFQNEIKEYSQWLKPMGGGTGTLEGKMSEIFFLLLELCSKVVRDTLSESKCLFVKSA